MSFRILDQPLDPVAALEAVRSPSCGAIATFLGTVRNHAEGRQVLYLDYEVQETMALRQFERIASRLRERHDVSAIAIDHRRGRVEPGGISVVIAVSAQRRSPALAACAEAIELLKKEAPIWKKEVFSDGHRWVQGS